MGSQFKVWYRLRERVPTMKYKFAIGIRASLLGIIGIWVLGEVECFKVYKAAIYVCTIESQ